MLLGWAAVAGGQQAEPTRISLRGRDTESLLASLPSAPSVSRADAEERFASYVAAGLQDSRLLASRLEGTEIGLLRPLVSPQAPRPYKVALARGFSMAVEQLEKVPGCGALFAQLGASGPLLLGTTVFLAPEGEEFAEVCRASRAAAMTRLGSHVTYLCPPFARLSRRGAAVAILHEALHYAGVPERPVHPEGLSSAEISALVRARCDL